MIYSSIQPFVFEHHPIRIVDREGQPWFALSDVCAVLDISNVGNAAARLDDDERDSIRNTDVNQGRGNPNLTIINESGLYKLILRSRKPAAKRFTKWLTSEVLPSIRRTGQYGAPARPLDLMDTATLHQLLLAHTGKTLALENRVEEMAPQVDALARLTNAAGDLCITDAAKTLDMPPKRLFHWLMAHDWIYRREKSQAYAAYQSRLSAGLLRQKVTRITRTDGSARLVEQIRVTPKGMGKLAQLMSGKNNG